MRLVAIVLNVNEFKTYELHISAEITGQSTDYCSALSFKEISLKSDYHEETHMQIYSESTGRTTA